jgi:uroporphyrinogen-III synthase
MTSLRGLRILVTRPEGQSSHLAALLEAEGATVLQIPTIAIAPPASYCALDAAIIAIRTYDWLLFTSANAVRAFAARARTLNLPPHPRRVAAIGQATARALAETGVAPQADLIPPQAVAESFAETLVPYAPGASMLLVRAADARDLLPDALTTAGATITIAEAYRNVVPPEAAALLRELFTTNPPDAITFTSASTANNLAAILIAAQLTLPPTTILASIGPITTQAMRDLNLEPTIEAQQSNIPSLIEALIRHVEGSAPR